jgi:hypothetical protein
LALFSQKVTFLPVALLLHYNQTGPKMANSERESTGFWLIPNAGILLPKSFGLFSLGFQQFCVSPKPVPSTL